MRRLITFIFLFFYMGILMAQQETYTRIFSGMSYDEGIAAFRLPNKEIRLIGNTGSYGHGSTDIWLIALDSNGDFLWHKFYGTPEIEKATDAIMTPQGDIFIVGSTSQYYSKSYQVYFLGLDPYGQIIASESYGGKDWDFAYGICQTSDSTFAIVGETYSKGAGQSDVYLLHVNRQGDTLWTKTYGGLMEDRGSSVKLMPDQGLIVTGTTKSFGNGSFDFYLLRLNPQGDTLWTNVLNHITDAELLDVLIKPDTSIVTCGYRKDTMDTYRDFDLKEYSQEGNLVWDHYVEFHEGSDCYASTIINRPNGNILFGGTSTYRPTADARIIQADSEGWFKSSVFLGTNEAPDYGHKLTRDIFHGEHYFMIGTTKGYGVSMSGLFFIRVDSNLYADTTRIVDLPTSVLTSNRSQKASLYPNPVQDYLSIEFEKWFEGGELRVYDLIGREVIQKRLRAGQSFEIDTRELSNGMYQILIKGQKDLFQYRFIKQSNF